MFQHLESDVAVAVTLTHAPARRCSLRTQSPVSRESQTPAGFAFAPAADQNRRRGRTRQLWTSLIGQITTGKKKKKGGGTIKWNESPSTLPFNRWKKPDEADFRWRLRLRHRNDPERNDLRWCQNYCTSQQTENNLLQSERAAAD